MTLTLYRVIDSIFWLLNLAILLRVLFSWINPDPGNAVVHLIYQITEPILAPLRRYIPSLGGLDITPMIALLLLELLHRLLMDLIF
jgi:YggT family protein